MAMEKSHSELVDRMRSMKVGETYQPGGYHNVTAIKDKGARVFRHRTPKGDRHNHSTAADCASCIAKP